jgi:hypothetical protein
MRELALVTLGMLLLALADSQAQTPPGPGKRLSVDNLLVLRF